MTVPDIDEPGKQAVTFSRMTTIVGALKAVRDDRLDADNWSNDILLQKMWCLMPTEVHVEKAR